MTGGGIPAIEPYAMPEAQCLPANRVGWECDPSRAMLLVHDLQNYFVAPFTSDAPPLSVLAETVPALARRARALGIPVAYSAQPGSQSERQRGLQLDMWGAGIGSDPRDAEIWEAARPQPGDSLLVKWRYDAFHRTELADLLRREGRDQLIVTGIYAHIGCLMTSAQAFMRDIQVFFVADAVADFSREDHEAALRWAAGRCARVLTTEALLATLPEPPTGLAGTSVPVEAGPRHVAHTPSAPPRGTA
ncbi:isochorismatase family protein [Streptomyces sp. PTM05]|uniref:Isochorismatase family protein n=1 Tax=Streptantibioticus parmotrematis TaxID=2873249 RepID=A0ABS7QUU6_9ACTN|nr:isochorismatase family protein [Streptantibioticus parmotrematis]MBY8886987.1 isochorismatase family protein [Streptantibioticus parmotrematis]